MIYFIQATSGPLGVLVIERRNLGLLRRRLDPLVPAGRSGLPRRAKEDEIAQIGLAVHELNTERT